MRPPSLETVAAKVVGMPAVEKRTRWRVGTAVAAVRRVGAAPGAVITGLSAEHAASARAPRVERATRRVLMRSCSYETRTIGRWRLDVPPAGARCRPAARENPNCLLVLPNRSASHATNECLLAFSVRTVIAHVALRNQGYGDLTRPALERRAR